MPQTDWANLLHQEDVEGLWNALYKLVTRHPSVRPLRFATDETATASDQEINADLAQELFLELFQKQRFQYYLSNGYTSTEIENELTHIELPNLVGARLRKRYPESFRMARRVSSLLKTSDAFRRFGGGEPVDGYAHPAKANGHLSGQVQNGLLKAVPASGEEHLEAEAWDDDQDDPEAENAQAGTGSRRQRMVNRMFGLKSWPASKHVGDPGLFPELASPVPVRPRDTRVVGRSASSQLIISNKALEDLIVEIFAAIDSPADVKTIRQLTLSKISLQDYSISALDGEFARDEAGSGASSANSAVRALPHSPIAIDCRPSPEEELLGEEHREALALLAREFLAGVHTAVNKNPQRYERMLQTLWYCYFDPKGLSQIEVAEVLGVSDSLISNNRKLIEYELKKLALSLEDGMAFSESLGQLVKQHRRRGMAVAPAPGRSTKPAHVKDARLQPERNPAPLPKVATSRRNRA